MSSRTPKFVDRADCGGGFDYCQLAQHVVQHRLLVALVVQEVRLDLLQRQVQRELPEQLLLHLRREPVDVMAHVDVLC